MGVFMALLSFAAFLVFFLATLSLKRETLFQWFHDWAAKSPDPQTQQMILWYTTNEGFIVITIFSLLIALVLFLAAGAVSGAMLSRTKKLPLAS